MRLVTETSFSIVCESGFPKNALMHEHRAVRAVVIVNRRPLAWLPAQHQHLNEFILHHPVTRIVARLEAEIWLHFVVADLSALDQLVNLGQRRNGTKRV